MKVPKISGVEVVERCPICGEGRAGTITVNGVTRDINLACACVSSRPQDSRANALARAFGSRQPRGSFKADDGVNRGVTDVCKNYVESFGTIMYGKVNGLLLFGQPRQGKTFMAEAITSEIVNKGYSALFRTASEVVQTFQYDNKAEVNRIRDAVKAVDLLVIDDLGAQRSTAFADEVVFTIIDERYSARKPIIVTTNATVEEMAGTDDVTLQRCYGRLIERCTLVQVDSSRSCVN